jgi:hypothetical protein
MKRSTMYLTILAVLLALGSLPLFAQRGGGHAGAMGMGHGPGGPNSDGKGKMSGMNGSKGSSTLTGKESASEILSRNTKLASKLETLLKKQNPPITDLQLASSGFKNLGQFVAAVHVSNNLGIPFDELKAKMTGPNGESLGKAIHALKPEANTKAELKKSHTQTLNDLKESERDS